MNKKRKQHYVPRLYLRGWAVNNQIYTLRDKDIFLTALENVANKRDFYRLNPITKDGLQLIETFLKDIPPAVKEKFKELIDLLSVISNSFHSIKENINLDAVQKEADNLLNDLVENLYAQIEGDAIPYIENLRDGDANFGNNEDVFLDFVTFLCFQYTRTDCMRENALNSMPEKYKSSWGILRILIALSIIGKINYEYEDWTFELLNNRTTLPFITGGQPVINLCQVEGEEVKEMILYYPVSPKYAIIVSKKTETKGLVNRDIIDEQDADWYNKKIKEHSQGLLFSNDENTLLRYSS